MKIRIFKSKQNKPTYSYMKIGPVVKVGLILVSMLLSWRLLRFSDPFFDYWTFYHYVLGILYVASSFFSLSYMLQKKIPIFSLYIFLFVVVGLSNKLIFPGFDSFTVALSTFILYFLLERVWRKVHDAKFFHGFHFVLIVLLMMNFLDFLNMHFLNENIFNYSRAVNEIDAIISVGDKSRQFLPELLPFIGRGRAPGISGTSYATSALIAASAIYFYLSGSRLVFTLSSILLFLWATGSTFIVYLLVLMILNRKRRIMPLLFVFCIILGYIVILERGLNIEGFFLKFSLNLTPSELFLALIFGEGQDVSGFATEFRVFGMFLSLGLIGSFLLTMIMGKYWSFLKQVRHEGSYNSFRAGFWFILTLFLCNWHYQTFFIYPNMVLVVALLAFVSTRIFFSRNVTMAPQVSESLSL